MSTSLHRPVRHALVGALGGAAVALLVGGVTGLVEANRTTPPSGDPGDRARQFAESISETINAVAFANVVLVPLGIGWGLYQARVK